MTQQGSRFRFAETVRAAARGDSPAWLRVLLLGGALGLGTCAYYHHVTPFTLWGRWLLELAAGWLLLTLALHEDRPLAESAARRWARRSMWVVVLVATAAAIRLVPQPGREVAAAVAVGTGVLAFFAARWVPFAADDVAALTGGARRLDDQPPRLRLLRIVIAGAALAAAVAAARVNATHHVAGFALWLTSLGLFAGSMVRRSADTDDRATQRWMVAGGPQLSRRTEWLLLGLIMVLALTLRLPFLQEIPTVVNSDEGRLGRYAERMWQPGFPDAFEIGWNVFPHLAFMVQYASVQVLGTSNGHLRASSGVVGALCILPLFYWVRRWWGNVIAVLAAAALAINGEDIAWSRIALNNIQQVLVAVLMLAAFARLLSTGRWLDWVWLGYASGLAFHTYHAAKLFPALLAVTFLFFAVGSRGFARRYLSGALVGAVAFVLCLGPLLVTAYQRWDFFYRSQSNRVDLGYLIEAYRRADTAGVRAYISSHVITCLLSFITMPAPVYATFDPFVAVPFLLGVGWMLWHWRDPRHLTVLVWILGILVIGGMITDYPPNKPRMIGFLPAACLIPAVVAGRARALLFRWAPARADVIAVPGLLLWLGAALQRNWYTEFVTLPAMQHGDMMTELCRAVDHAPLPATVYMAGGATMEEPKVAANDCMIAPRSDRILVNLPDDPAIVPVPPSNTGNAVFLIAPRQRELLPLVWHYYPEARYEVVTDHDERTILHIVTLPAAMIDQNRGLRGTFRTPNRTWSTKEGTAAFAIPAEAELPVSATWQGQLWIPAPGTYTFRTGGVLRLDGNPLAEERPCTLAAGWHSIELSATFSEKTGSVALQWRRPDATAWTPIPRAFLNTHPETHGLMGRYFRGAVALPSNPAMPIAAAPDYTRIDTVLSFDWYTELDDRPPEAYAARPGVMEWVGTVDVPEGSNTLRLEATNPAQVFINGTLVLSAQGKVEGERVDRIIDGLSGRVPILVRIVRPADSEYRIWKLRLFWGEPGGGWTAFVPYHPAEIDEHGQVTSLR